jgi:succinate-acetate transporter protein
MKNWRPVDAIIAMLVAAIVYLTVVHGTMLLFSIKSMENEAQMKVIAGLVSPIIGIIGVYIGLAMKNKDD